MEWIGLVVGLVIGVAIATVIYQVVRRKRRASGQSARPMPTRATGDGAQVAVYDEPLMGSQNITLPDIFQFAVGAYIVHGIEKDHVLGKVVYCEGKYTWVEYYLTDTSWLGADKDEGDQLIAWDRVIPSDLEPNGKRPIVFQGVTYYYVERGEASYTASGDAGDLSGSGTVEYVDFATEDGQNHLSFERYDGESDWEVAIGETMVIGLIDYYPPGAYVPDANGR